jgi:hypothetical protein
MKQNIQHDVPPSESAVDKALSTFYFFGKKSFV